MGHPSFVLPLSLLNPVGRLTLAFLLLSLGEAGSKTQVSARLRDILIEEAAFPLFEQFPQFP
jgi:hypothetical protein